VGNWGELRAKPYGSALKRVFPPIGILTKMLKHSIEVELSNNAHSMSISTALTTGCQLNLPVS
jgi:hypothetical protein